MMRYPLTLNHILERAGKLFGKREIVSRLPDKSLHRYVYADFYRRARALAQALQQAGLQRGDRVGTLMWNHYAHLEAYFGIPAAGGVLHTLNLRLHPDDIAWIANHAEDRFLIVDDVLLPLFEKVKAQIRVERVIVAPLTGKPVPAGYDNYEQFLQTATGDFQYPDLDENAPCGMCYTSGTTGRSKGVVYSHRSTVLHAFMQALPDQWDVSSRDVVLPVVPMFHANAWGVPYTATMIGAKQVFPGPHLDAENLLDLFDCEQVTITGGVPTIWLGLLQTLERNPGRWRLKPRMLVGGSAVPESMIRAYEKHNLEVVHAWGMTEISPIGTMARLKPGLEQRPPDEQFAYRAKQGVAVPFVEVRVIGDHGEAPWDGQTVGEIQVRGPWVTASYHNVPQDPEKFTPDGWLRTGDVATIDAEGYVKITDRTKDLIKSGGEWISSVDLENAVMGHAAVQEAAVIAVPHPRWQERPLAVIVLKPSAKATADDIRHYLAERFAKWMLPDAYVFVSEIPRTSTGKFLKTKLREEYKNWRWDEAQSSQAVPQAL